MVRALVAIVCVFVGSFLGIGLDWEARGYRQNVVTPTPNPSPNDITYRVEGYEKLALAPYQGDTIHLTRADANPAGTSLAWLNDSPCQTSGNDCTILSKAKPGYYFFYCSASDKYDCPDPGIVVRPAPVPPVGLNRHSFLEKLDRDYGYFFTLRWLRPTQNARPEISSESSSGSAPLGGLAPPVLAKVSPAVPLNTFSCDNSNLTELDPIIPGGGTKNQTTTITLGQTVFWEGHNTMILDFSHASDPKVCDPAGNNLSHDQSLKCTPVAKGSYSYFATYGACTTSPVETIIVN